MKGQAQGFGDGFEGVDEEDAQAPSDLTAVPAHLARHSFEYVLPSLPHTCRKIFGHTHGFGDAAGDAGDAGATDGVCADAGSTGAHAPWDATVVPAHFARQSLA
jgi:hypothetical protein